jgi:rare lipoprotein A
MVALAIPILATGCGTILKHDKKGNASSASTLFGTAKKKGGYYLDDGPGDNPPADLHLTPDAIPRDEPLRPANMRPYAALGRWYTPMTVLEPYRARGIASWYGRRYHGQKTASGEVYDMYGMTAAHTTLPIPSYARVTNVANGKSVVVRVNDRGPFLSDRLIDLSYTAAYKLDVLGGGSARVEVESILPRAESARQIAAPPLVPNSILASNSASVPASSSTPSRIPITVREKAMPAALVVEPQNREAKPDLVQADYRSTAPEIYASRAADTPVAGDTGAVYLQLGAFSAYDNADNFLARMRAELPSLMNNLGIVAKDGLFKVHAGPYPDKTLARQAADKIAQSLSIKPMLLLR